ncbi:hypothetical protein L6P87_33820, partial [Klebsiella pneumoniae]|nr:hypothetical protein [Klebsiella pneumoniae]
MKERPAGAFFLSSAVHAWRLAWEVSAFSARRLERVGRISATRLSAAVQGQSSSSPSTWTNARALRS